MIWRIVMSFYGGDGRLASSTNIDREYHPNIEGYESVYGLLPTNSKELAEYLKQRYGIDDQSLQREIDRINDIRWIEKDFTFFLVPKGTPRPRTGGGHFYVKGARQMQKIVQREIADGGVICTRIEYELEAFLPTPINTMTKQEVVLAELGHIRPLVTPDWDNIGKTYTDCLQGFIMLNDNLINPGCVKKYYSIKPRINIHLRYQADFDSNYNRRKILGTTSYKNLMESK